MNSILKSFKEAGIDASYHWADDTCKEWPQARAMQNKAMDIYWDHPRLQPEMREIAKGFIWTYDFEKLTKEQNT